MSRNATSHPVSAARIELWALLHTVADDSIDQLSIDEQKRS